MRVLVVCPAPRGSRLGNRITAERWARLLRELGSTVRVSEALEGTFDVLVALHARKSAPAIAACRRAHPAARIVVAMTGTDLYRDLPRSAAARRSLELADRIVVLHPGAIDALPSDARRKAVVIVQSARPISISGRRRRDDLQVAVVGHLRHEKDPLRAAFAARELPASSRVRIVHAGRALSDRWARAAQAETRRNARYRWLGEASPIAARRLIARSDVLVLSSRMEGGANVLGEAIVSGTAVVAARIPATVSLLGEDHAGLFPVGDTAALTALLRRCEEEPSFLRALRRASIRRRSFFSRAREQKAWRSLLASLTAARRANATRS